MKKIATQNVKTVNRAAQSGKFLDKKNSKAISTISFKEMVRKAELSYGDVIRKLAHE